jgi:hypothetical protein
MCATHAAHFTKTKTKQNYAAETLKKLTHGSAESAEKYMKTEKKLKNAVKNKMEASKMKSWKEEGLVELGLTMKDYKELKGKEKKDVDNFLIELGHEDD